MGIGAPELLVIFIVALLVFGPRKLPEIGRSIGKTIAELKRVVEGHVVDLGIDGAGYEESPEKSGDRSPEGSGEKSE